MCANHSCPGFVGPALGAGGEDGAIRGQRDFRHHIDGVHTGLQAWYVSRFAWRACKARGAKDRHLKIENLSSIESN